MMYTHKQKKVHIKSRMTRKILPNKAICSLDFLSPYKKMLQVQGSTGYTWLPFSTSMPLILALPLKIADKVHQIWQGWYSLKQFWSTLCTAYIESLILHSASWLIFLHFISVKLVNNNLGCLTIHSLLKYCSIILTRYRVISLWVTLSSLCQLIYT